MTTKSVRTVGAVLCAFALGCGTPPPSERCEDVGTQAMSASAEGRWLIGLASRYPADTALGARMDELRRSQRARRAVAWEVVARVLAPVPIAQATSVPNATLPRFRTWYDREDIVRVFQRLYERLGPDGRATRQRFTEEALDEALGWNVDFVTTLPEWPASRLDSYAASMDSPAALTATAGLRRIAMSPDAVRHLVNSYPEILRCLENGAPPVFADGRAVGQRLAREFLQLSPCGTVGFGPYFVATGGTLEAKVNGTDAPTELKVLEGVGSMAPVRCVSSGERGCTVAGPGVFRVLVASTGRATRGTLDVQYSPPDVPFAGCLNGIFPPSAAMVALEWRRADIGIPFPVYDTSAAGLARRLAPGADATWGMGDGTAQPNELDIYTLRLPSGSTFQLAGMHIRTRELDHWLNITLWWSPTPDEDFGADRPASVRALGAPWVNYKMCVAVDFDEWDPDPAGGFAHSAPSLAAALRTVYEGLGGPSWCSNPYIDAGPGLVRSNCVGCHQHALSGVRPAEVQNDMSRYPANGRARVRNNFPSDGCWAIDAGDQLGAVFSETVDYWRSNR